MLIFSVRARVDLQFKDELSLKVSFLGLKLFAIPGKDKKYKFGKYTLKKIAKRDKKKAEKDAKKTAKKKSKQADKEKKKADKKKLSKFTSRPTASLREIAISLISLAIGLFMFMPIPTIE